MQKIADLVVLFSFLGPWRATACSALSGVAALHTTVRRAPGLALRTYLFV